MPAVLPPRYRSFETKWTQGAHFRGVQRDKYVLIRVSNDSAVFGRSGDQLLIPPPIEEILDRSPQKIYKIREILVGKAAWRLQNQDWEVREVNENEITKVFRARLKHPFVKIQGAGSCLSVLSGITSGKLSLFHLKKRNYELKDIKWLVIYPGHYAYYYGNGPSADGRIILENYRPPSFLSETLSSMSISIHLSPRAVIEKESLRFILENLRRVIFKIQQEADEKKHTFAVRLSTINLKAEVDPENLRVTRLWISSAQDPAEKIFYPVMTPDEFFRINLRKWEKESRKK